ncbi:tyrosine-type recombinase/integrase [Ligilactobacillus salivarius]
MTPHGLRHTHATLLFESGASIKQVQTRLGLRRKYNNGYIHAYYKR